MNLKVVLRNKLTRDLKFCKSSQLSFAKNLCHYSGGNYFLFINLQSLDSRHTECKLSYRSK
jgi:hypothetical protein